MQSEIDSLREINSKLLAEITELKKKNAEVKAENVKLKHALEKHEARFTSLEQRDEEKATLIAKLDDNIKEIKQSSASTSSRESAIQETSSIFQNTTSNCYERKNKQSTSACEDLIKEIFTSISCNAPIQNHLRATSHDSISFHIHEKILLTSGQGKSDILQNIANLYKKACDAEDVSIKANQVEILCWSNFIIAFDKSIDEITKGLIYNFILVQNPNTKRPALYKKIERARKIYRLTEKIGLNKVKHIKSSANSISKFTNEEIQRVIDHFTKNPNMEFTDNSKDEKQDNDQIGASEMQEQSLDSAEVSISTAPIPSTHVSNSSEEKLPNENMNTVSKDIPSVKSQVSVPSTSSSGQIRKSNKSRLPISILPEDPKEK
ncbi:hypothetical protein RclHR1_13560006 [Rhizophagus clarus]|uniref:Uncharacterized protein n=2 Tax=Rhizophagus clarus TaxID=94130 RepID=A0A2Z6QQU1_9GLOM|nr:hypothetical protein RclHR1_13560006 [Rhizophagus clarus]